MSRVTACATHLPAPRLPVAKWRIGSMVTPGLAVLSPGTTVSPRLAEEEGCETATSPPVKDASWKSPPIGRNVVTWPHLAAREEGRHRLCLDGRESGSFVEKGEVTGPETARRRHGLQLTSRFCTGIPVLGKVKAVFAVYGPPGFLVPLLPLHVRRGSRPLTHTCRNRVLDAVWGLRPAHHLRGACFACSAACKTRFPG